MNVSVNDNNTIVVHTNFYDLCFNCKNVHKCPLVNALSNELVLIRYSELLVDECELYKK
jgi:hypothetical protein